jgi:hypothetical protein
MLYAVCSLLPAVLQQCNNALHLHQLYDLLPFLDTLAEIDDVVSVLKRKNFDFLTNPTSATTVPP